MAHGSDPAVGLGLVEGWIQDGRRSSPSPHEDGIKLRSYADIRPEEVTWLWPGRVAAGALTLLVGVPGLGKTLLGVWLAARLSRGDLGGQATSVLYCTAEDSPEHTLTPRLIAAGAARERVYDVRLTRDGFDEGLALPDDIDALREGVERAGAGLVVIDPLMAHLACKIDSHRDHSIRRALAPIRNLAEETGCGLLVIGHLNKAQGTDLFARVGGSIGLTAAARGILLLTTDPERANDESARLLVQGKNSLGPLAPALRCQVATQQLETSAGSIETVRIHLGEEAAHLRVHDVLRPTEGDTRTALDEARDFLVEELHEGPLPAKTLQARAEQEGHALRTLRRAATELGVDKRKSGFHAGWEWSLSAEAVRSLNNGPFGSRRPREEAAGEDSLEGASGAAPSTRPSHFEELGHSEGDDSEGAEKDERIGRFGGAHAPRSESPDQSPEQASEPSPSSDERDKTASLKAAVTVLNLTAVPSEAATAADVLARLDHVGPAHPDQIERLRQLASDPGWGSRRRGIEAWAERTIGRGALTEQGAYALLGILGERLTKHRARTEA